MFFRDTIFLFLELLYLLFMLTEFHNPNVSYHV